MPVLSSKSLMALLNLTASSSVNGPIIVTFVPLYSPAYALSNSAKPVAPAAGASALGSSALGASALVGSALGSSALVGSTLGSSALGASALGCSAGFSGAGVAPPA